MIRFHAIVRGTGLLILDPAEKVVQNSRAYVSEDDRLDLVTLFHQLFDDSSGSVA